MLIIELARDTGWNLNRERGVLALALKIGLNCSGIPSLGGLGLALEGVLRLI